jgi:transposase
MSEREIVSAKIFLRRRFALDEFRRGAITVGMIPCDAAIQSDPALLPDDPTVLKQLVVQLLDELQKAHARLERQEHHMHLLLKRLYGSTSEKRDPRQGVLFDPQSGAEETPASMPLPPPLAAPVSRKRDRHGRGRIPDRIKREEVVHDFSEAELAALGGAENLVELPPERSEQLDWRPSTLFVVVHVRKKYARKVQLPESGLTLSEQNVVLAKKPPEAIPGALAGPGLMAQVITSKGADHLPLHRLEGIFKRQGVRLSRQTMDGWWLQTAEFLRPLYDLAVRVVLASHVIHTDDTPVKVRDAWQKQKYTGRFWPYVGDALHPLTVFDYTPTHQRDGPAAFLKDYRGYLQADAFTGYDGIYLESQGRIVEVACWAHARRKFHECRRLDAARMETALAWIGKLYAVEKDLRERCGGQWQHLTLQQRAGRIAAERQQRSRPLLNDFHAWLDAEAPKVLPKSQVRGAMDYTLNNWAALCVYTEDGGLDIDNNEGENSLRGLCLGRKNWLFLGNDRGGRAAAVHFSLLASCKRHGHDPWAYFRDVLTRLPAMLPGASEEELLPLLPHRWHPA